MQNAGIVTLRNSKNRWVPESTEQKYMERIREDSDVTEKGKVEEETHRIFTFLQEHTGIF